MISDKITFFFFKEDKVAINEKKHIGYLKIFIRHVCVCVYVYIHTHTHTHTDDHSFKHGCFPI